MWETCYCVCVCVCLYTFFWWCSNKINFLFTDFYELWRRRRYILRLPITLIAGRVRDESSTYPRHQFIIVNKLIGFFFQIFFWRRYLKVTIISFLFFFSKYCFHKIETSLLKLATFTGGTKNFLCSAERSAGGKWNLVAKKENLNLLSVYCLRKEKRISPRVYL